MILATIELGRFKSSGRSAIAYVPGKIKTKFLSSARYIS
jgi:hypothetical protein